MMIPTVFDETNKATLEVVYYTYAGGVQSRDYVVTYPITKPFVVGNAYTYILAFEQNTDMINFSVQVEPWAPVTPDTTIDAN